MSSIQPGAAMPFAPVALPPPALQAGTNRRIALRTDRPSPIADRRSP